MVELFIGSEGVVGSIPTAGSRNTIMYIELLLFLYLVVGFCIFYNYFEDVTEHAKRVANSTYISRIIYIVAFFATVIMWPLLIGI